MSTQKTENTPTCPDREKLAADLERLIEDAKVLTSDVSETSQAYFNEKAKDVRAQLNELIGEAKQHGECAKAKTCEGVETVEKLIIDRPWRAVGIAVLAGVVVDRLLRD